MSNYSIEEIPMQSDFENVINLPQVNETPAVQVNETLNSSDIEENLESPLEQESFEIQAECENHKFFGNITKKKVTPINKNWGMYLITGALAVTIGSKLIN